ncbi:hypothetical protein Tco_1386196, partial [Tanacetum coccineum]
ECMEKAQIESSLSKPSTDDDMNIELSEEFLMELRNERDGKITTWKELVEKFFCKLYPLSRGGKDEMLNDDDNGERDYFEFISQVNSKFDDHRKEDDGTKKVLLNSWINESWHKELMDDIVSSDEEWEESDYRTPPNTTNDSFIKPYLDAQEKNDIGKGDECGPKKCKGNTSELGNIILNNVPHSDKINDEQPNERVCKAEKFEVIKYSLGPNEEYIAINNCECNAWKRNKDSLAHIYQEIFLKRDEGWTVTRTKE